MNASVEAIRFDEESFWVSLSDGRTIGAPLAWFPRLMRASSREREKYTLSVHGIHWEHIGEDVSIDGLLAG